MSSATTKCKYYNSGYCKFASRRNGCRDIHPTENCKYEDCKDKCCPHRHPKKCKYVEYCMFQSRCLYMHNECERLSVSKEIYKCNDIVLDLKAEIAKLNDENYRKFYILSRFTLKSLMI